MSRHIYADRFTLLVSQLPIDLIHPSFYLHQFMTGLCEDVYIVVWDHKPNDLKEAIDYAIHTDEGHNNCRRNQCLDSCM